MLRRLASLIMKLGGWTVIGTAPDVSKAIFIAAPHTSNWDGLWALTCKVALGLNVKFFAKQSLFWFPLNILLRALGGIPLDRSEAGSAVSQAIAKFQSEEQFLLALAPEGTRSLTAGWKSGFYRIASEAKVPVFFAVLDYGERRMGIAGRLDLSGDIDADMKVCADLYGGIKGHRPELASPVRFT